MRWYGRTLEDWKQVMQLNLGSFEAELCSEVDLSEASCSSPVSKRQENSSDIVKEILIWVCQISNVWGKGQLIVHCYLKVACRDCEAEISELSREFARFWHGDETPGMNREVWNQSFKSNTFCNILQRWSHFKNLNCVCVCIYFQSQKQGYIGDWRINSNFFLVLVSFSISGNCFLE